MKSNFGNSPSNNILHSIPFDVLQYDFLPFLQQQDVLHLQEAVHFSLPLQRKISKDVVVTTLTLLVKAEINRIGQMTLEDVVKGLEVMKYALNDIIAKSDSRVSVQNFMGVFDTTLRDNLAFLREALLGIPSRIKVVQVADKNELQQAEKKLQEFLDHLIQKRNAYNKRRCRSA
jgi:hypothetical protein